jgi:DHA1 family tetracycline resistance protein-like MFS transporter
VMGLAETGLVFSLGIPLLALWGIANPAISSLMTRHVAATEQGQLQGANSSIQGIANLVGPFVFTLTFAWSIGGGRDAHMPGAVFILAAAMLVGAGAIAWHATRLRG